MFNKNDPAHLSALKAEITTDPKGLGYSSFDIGDLAGIAAKVSSIYPASINVQLGDVPTHKVRSCISLNDWRLMTPEERSYLHMLLDGDIVNLSDGMVDNNLVTSGGIWAPGPATTPGSAAARGLDSRARLMGVKQRKATRAEELFGIDTVLSWQDVKAALDS